MDNRNKNSKSEQEGMLELLEEEIEESVLEEDVEEFDDEAVEAFEEFKELIGEDSDEEPQEIEGSDESASKNDFDDIEKQRENEEKAIRANRNRKHVVAPEDKIDFESSKKRRNEKKRFEDKRSEKAEKISSAKKEKFEKRREEKTSKQNKNVGEEGYIRFENVKKIYRMGEVEIEALGGVDFSISKGEFVIIAGASGAGKSTILNILGGMDSLSSGRIFVDGNEISKYNDKQLISYRRYDVGFVFQFYNLVQNLNALENVQLATQICKNPLDAEQTIIDVGLEERKHNLPAQLSGGEQQRVAIARALAKNPKLLLCDEPTGALDYKTGKAILKLLQETSRKTGMTVVVITHNLALTAMGDKVIKVKSGKIESMEINENPLDVDLIEY